MSMTLSDLASIGELVSGIAVLLSLIYLSLQVRQAEKNQRALMNQGVVTRNTDVVIFQSQPHINELASRVSQGETQFSAPEIRLLQSMLRATLVGAQDSFVQHHAGMIDKITLENSRAAMSTLLSQPIFRALWRLGRGSYAPEWVAQIDRLRGEADLRLHFIGYGCVSSAS